MRAQFLFFLLSVPVALSCDAFPNGTETKLHWWQCSEGFIKYYNATPADANGIFEYPIHMAKPLIVWTEMESPKEFSKLRADIRIWSWGGLLCKWNELPTLGLLANMDACQHGFPCPLKKGRATIPVTLDFTAFDVIINLLKNDAPYQFEYKLTDLESGESACITAQAHAFVH